jgi:hypothetical protein
MPFCYTIPETYLVYYRLIITVICIPFQAIVIEEKPPPSCQLSLTIDIRIQMEGEGNE